MRAGWVLFAACVACGRTEAFEPVARDVWARSPVCALTAEASALDLGSVAPSERTTAAVTLENTGTATCTVDGFSLDGSDRGFMLGRGTGAPLEVPPMGAALVQVAFSSAESVAPYDRRGTLTMRTSVLDTPRLSIDLKVHLLHCELQVKSDPIEFGTVAPTDVAVRDVVVENVGDLACALGGTTIAGDASFGVASQDPVVPPGGTAIVRVVFRPDAAPPLDRQATASIVDDRGRLVGVVPLHGRVALCLLTATPRPLSFGNVPLNTRAERSLSLRNTGSAPCTAVNVRLGADTDRLFSLPSPPNAVRLAVGATARVAVAFDARDSAPPHLRTGTLLFDSDDALEPRKVVPLSAFINTICDERGQFIYTVDQSGTFARFDPVRLTSTPLGTLRCPTAAGATPFSMNVDQSANAWVLFSDGSLFRVDTANAACQATAYVPSQLGMTTFGMGSVFDTSTGVDTLFIAGPGPFSTEQATLATLELTTFGVAAIGPMNVGSVELAGTGDGQLWAFAPPGLTGSSALLDLVDPRTGATTEHHEIPAITTGGGGFATKFWGGAFYLFVGSDVWRISRSALLPEQVEPTEPPTLVFTDPGANVVGAGVSTCAPVGP